MIVGVCGYGFTGSGAVIDILQEYDDIDVILPDSEFIFTYTPHGILDLENSLVTHPARWMRSDFAIHEFKKLMEIYTRRFSDISVATKGEFTDLYNKYVQSIVQVKWNGMREISIRQNPNQITLYRVLSKMQYVVNRISKGTHYVFPKKELYLSIEPDGFLDSTKEFINNVIVAASNKASQIKVLNQPYPGTYPEQVFKYFDNPKAIIVDRDPRDVYLFAKYYARAEATWIPTNNVDDYIMYYRIIHNAKHKSDPRILHVQFEDLVYRTEEYRKRIIEFVGCSDKRNQMTFFKPQRSTANTNLKQRFPTETENIEAIERELHEFLYEFTM